MKGLELLKSQAIMQARRINEIQIAARPDVMAHVFLSLCRLPLETGMLQRCHPLDRIADRSHSQLTPGRRAGKQRASVEKEGHRPP